MGDGGDRMDRAGRYVLGLMDDDERERAERDLEIDPAFRDAMVEIAGRMHVFDRIKAPDKEAPQDAWRLIKERITAMPQMRPAPALEPMQPEQRVVPEQPVTFGRRKSDKRRDTIVPQTPAAAVGTGLHSVPGRRAFGLAFWLIVAFLLGYMAGKL